MRELHSQSATVDLAAGAEVLSHSVPTAIAKAAIEIEFGDGANDLDASVETTLTFAITVGGVPIRGTDQTETVAAGRARLRMPIDQIEVGVDETIVVTVTSSNSSDTAVAVTARLRDAAPLQPSTRGEQVTAASTPIDANATQMGGQTVNATSAIDMDKLGTMAARFTGITSLANWLKKIARKDFDDATAESEISGTYDDAIHSQEAIGEKTKQLGSGVVNVSDGVVGDDGTITKFYQGDDYASDTGGTLQFTWTFGSFAVSGGSSLFEAEPVEGESFKAVGTLGDNGDGTATASIPVTEEQSDLLEVGPIEWRAIALTSGGKRKTIASGSTPLVRRAYG